MNNILFTDQNKLSSDLPSESSSEVIISNRIKYGGTKHKERERERERETAIGVQRREGNQLDATECFIALIICSTCFGHSYAHHQELESIFVLLPHMVCNALVAGGRLLGAELQATRPGRGKL